ncbi:MAG: hypothetical protein V8S22_06930 [Lachnospiraceae bacterium]
MNGVIAEQLKLSQTLKASADSIKKIENAKDLTDKLTELSEALTELEAATNAESDLQTGAAAVATVCNLCRRCESTEYRLTALEKAAAPLNSSSDTLAAGMKSLTEGAAD